MIHTYSSRERVARTFRHEPIDRVAIDYAANPIIDRKLKQHFHLSADNTEGLLQALHVDFREIQVPYTGPVLHNPLPDRQVDPEWGIVTRWIANQYGGYWDYCDFPLHELTMEAVENWEMPSPDDYAYDQIPEMLSTWPDKSIYVGNPGLGDILNTTGMFCGMDTIFIALALEDPAWMLLVDRRLEQQLEVTARILEKAKGRIDFMWLGEDLGTQTGPIISPSMYQRLLKPRHRRFVELAEAFSIPVMIHSCGSSSWAFPDFIDIGISAIDTLQPEAADMDPALLKSRFGKDLAFHGGVSTAGALAEGSADEAVADLHHVLDVMMPDGGYFFATTHQIQDNTPLENVLAVYKAAISHGRYTEWL